MTIFQSKTSNVDAIQWTCNNYEEVKTFTDNRVALTADNSCVIVSGVTACNGDWVLKFTGQENSNGPTVTRFSVLSDAAFQDQYEVIV